jgi:nucleoside-diphosphate-sugar epimerase
LAFHRNYDFQVRVARYHNIFGPRGAWCNGREKAPAAICRKIAMTKNGDEIEIWGDGDQTRSFLYIDECIEGTLRLMRSDWTGPVNIGSEEIITINELADMVMDIANKRLIKKHIKGPQGVRGRNSHNEMIEKKLGWRPKEPLYNGLEKTYKWIKEQVEKKNE